MNHFFTISKLEPRVKNKLKKDHHDLHTFLPKLLYVKGQGNFDKFMNDFSIMTFSFVRHPFARFVTVLPSHNKTLFNLIYFLSG